MLDLPSGQATQQTTHAPSAYLGHVHTARSATAMLDLVRNLFRPPNALLKVGLGAVQSRCVDLLLACARCVARARDGALRVSRR